VLESLEEDVEGLFCDLNTKNVFVSWPFHNTGEHIHHRGLMQGITDWILIKVGLPLMLSIRISSLLNRNENEYGLI